MIISEADKDPLKLSVSTPRQVAGRHLSSQRNVARHFRHVPDRGAPLHHQAGIWWEVSKLVARAAVITKRPPGISWFKVAPL
jgi:hypothetical protein